MNIAFCSIGALRNEKEATRITLFHLAQELTNRGHFVTILCQKAPGYPDRERSGGIILRRERFPFIPQLFTPAYAVKKAEKEMKINFDIIHCFSSTPLFALSGFLTKMVSPRVKIIHTLRSYSRTKLGNSGNFLLNLAAKVTVPHQTFARRLRTVFHNKIRIIPSSIDLSRFFPHDKKLLKRKYGYENTAVVLHYGAMWPGKGTALLLQAVSLIKASPGREALRFVLAPRYNTIQHLHQQVKKLNIEERVEFITGTVDIEDYVNLADVVVLPYLHLEGTEGQPSCLLEAMACKTAVITTKLPEIEELAGDSVFLVEPNKARDLAETILLALSDPSPAMIEKAYRRAQGFSISNSGQKYLELYQEVLLPEQSGTAIQ